MVHIKLPDQGSNVHPRHWKVKSQPLCHQGSPFNAIFLIRVSRTNLDKYFQAQRLL